MLMVFVVLHGFSLFEIYFRKCLVICVPEIFDDFCSVTVCVIVWVFMCFQRNTQNQKPQTKKLVVHFVFLVKTLN